MTAVVHRDRGLAHGVEPGLKNPFLAGGSAAEGEEHFVLALRAESRAGEKYPPLPA